MNFQGGRELAGPVTVLQGREAHPVSEWGARTEGRAFEQGRIEGFQIYRNLIGKKHLRILKTTTECFRLAMIFC